MQTTCSISNIFDVFRPRQGAKDMEAAGLDTAVLDFRYSYSQGDFENWGTDKYKSSQHTVVIENPDKMYERMSGIINQCKEHHICFSIAQAPTLARNTKQGLKLQDKLEELIEESIRISGKLGCKQIIVRPLTEGIEPDKIWKVNREFYIKLAKVGYECDVTILLENQCKNVNGHLVRGVCSDAAEACRWIDKLNAMAYDRYGSPTMEYFGFCMNVGTCNICGINMYDYALLMGDRIKAVILNDCDGNNENSLLPFSCVNGGVCQTDWLNLIRGLRTIRFDGNLIMDASTSVGAFSPMLKPTFLTLLKKTLDYFKWQIEIENLLDKYSSRVLFGAGNMCRNYMKNYGKQYPPLFTCDNNSALWGQAFEGLTINNPESLKELPEDTAIFICNIYYREIEEQLRGMGLKNPIEFFNDEYMPTYNFDRLDSFTRKSDKGDK